MSASSTVMRIVLSLVVGFAILFLSASRLAAQSSEITGAVTDATGAVIAGAEVSVVHVGTGQTRRVSTNEVGNYSVPFLTPGIYNIVAESQGFKSAARNDVDLQVGQVARIDFRLEVGEVSERIEVTGGAPLLATESTALGTVIENKRIVDLPLNGRNYLQLISLSPNVVAEASSTGGGGLQGGARSRAAYSVAGQRLEFNRYTLDGVENTDPNFNSYVIQPSVDAIQEFKVQTGVYSAEFGRSTSQISATTKSGTNQFHGALFEFLRNDKLDAREWLQSEGDKNPFRRNQFGGTLGGPIVRNKLFFLTNLEFTRDRKTNPQTASVATDRMRAGDFSAAGRRIFDPLTREYIVNEQGVEQAISAEPFPNQIIPRSRFNPKYEYLVQEFYPAPTVPGDSITRNYIRNVGRAQDSEQFNQRVDWTQSARSNWFVRYSWGNELEESPSAFLGQGTNTETTVQQGAISNTHILTTSAVNEFRFGWNNFDNDRVNLQAFERNVQEELGIPGLFAANPASYGIPATSVGNGISGFGGGDPWVARNHTFQFIDNISLIRGRHSMKFGFEYRRDRYNNFGNQKATGEFIFDGRATFDPANRNSTGFGYADFMIGETAQAARALAAANALLRGSSYYTYFLDDWKITPRMTLNLGLRYENTRPWYDKYRGIMNVQMFDPGVGPGGLLEGTQVPILTRPGDGDFYEDLAFRFHDGIPIQAGDQYIGRSLVNADNNDLAPRIGLAYSPTDRWTLRAGLGAFYTKDTGNPVFDMARNQAGRGFFASDEERRNSNLSDPWAFQRANFQCSGWDFDCLGPFQVLANVVNRRTPYVFQWMFNAQRQLTDDLMVELGYQANAGHKLERLRTYNQAILRTGPDDARSIAERRPWTAYDRIQIVDGSVNSNYHALSLKLQQRFSRGLTYLLGYTWSKAIDNGSAIRTNSGDPLWPVNSYDLGAERGLSQFHSGRRFVASAVYELPFGKGKPFLNGSGVLQAVLGGWQLGGIITLADGTPADAGTIGDTFAVGGLGNRPHATGISPFPEEQTAARFWNREAFDASSPTLSWLQGNVGSRVLIGPGTNSSDLSLAKNIQIREGQQLQFRLETFNSFNHPNWNRPSTDARAPTFGVITSARTMRELQFGLKYVF